MRQPVDIAFVARDRLFRSGLAGLLPGSRFRLVASYATVSDALMDLKTSSAPPALLLVDHDSAVGEPKLIMSEIRETLPDIRVAVLVPRSDTSVMLRYFTAGADGTLLRDMSDTAFLEALGLVVTGERVYPATLLSELLRARLGDSLDWMTTPVDRTYRQLSDRERQVVRALSKGMSNREIAEELGISEGTVKVHLRRISRLTKSDNRIQIALWALKNNVINGPDVTPASD